MSGSSQILPGALKAANAVFKSLNVRLSSRLGDKWPPGPGADVIKSVQAFFTSNLSDLGEHPFGLRIDQFGTATQGPLTAAFIREELMAETGTVLITVDSSLKIIDSKPVPVESDTETWLDRMQEESASHPVFYFEQANCLWVCGGGGSFVNWFLQQAKRRGALIASAAVLSTTERQSVSTTKNGLSMELGVGTGRTQGSAS